jgi:hypothetical protein
MKRLSIFIVLLVFASAAQAQELQAKVTVMAQRVATTVDKKIFTTLQTQLTNFLNNRQWTKDKFQQTEKIECNFILNLQSTDEINVYKATLVVQAARPVYNSNYQTAVINFQDPDVTFKYIEYQPVEFNENRVQGSDPLVGNLTATMAYYAYIILGMDYDSFSPKGGEPFFIKAQNIVNAAPESSSIAGWKAFDGLRNRYWLAENLVNSKYNQLHDAFYTYYRLGLDIMSEKPEETRASVLRALNILQEINRANPNTMILQTFVQGKSIELIGIFKNASPQEKQRAVDILSLLDVSNAAKYKDGLK